MACALHVTSRVRYTLRARWFALGVALAGCDPIQATVGIQGSSDDQLSPPSHEADDTTGHDPEGGDGDSPAGDGDSSSPGADAAVPYDCVDLLDLSLFVGDAGVSGPIEGQTLKDFGCTQLDGGMWLEPTNSSVWYRKDGEALLEANRTYSFFFTEAFNVTKLRLTGGRDSCDTRKIYEELPFIPRLPVSPACRTLRVGFDVHFLRHSGGQAMFWPSTINPASYQLCKGACQ